ncbi:hypothetical protein RRG08_048887 [Elysia crispata]|uniref:Uncharacterized protein n=1 Tax=Elysia crispata TaxID=231223 RepID=A0AAE1D499_9GAST|nr:hypothetical protein RRG08_048887 [Elysia crispata]
MSVYPPPSEGVPPPYQAMSETKAPPYPGPPQPQPQPSYPPPHPGGGYAAPQYPPPHGAYPPPQGTHTVTVVHQAPPQTVIVEERGVNHLLHFLIFLCFPPWIFVWIILCIVN